MNQKTFIALTGKSES